MREEKKEKYISLEQNYTLHKAKEMRKQEGLKSIWKSPFSQQAQKSFQTVKVNSHWASPSLRQSKLYPRKKHLGGLDILYPHGIQMVPWFCKTAINIYHIQHKSTPPSATTLKKMRSKVGFLSTQQNMCRQRWFTCPSIKLCALYNFESVILILRLH